MRLPRLVSGVHRVAGCHESTTAGVQPLQLRPGEDAANYIKSKVGGEVHCGWVEYCEGHMPNIHCGAKEICYWWPY
jgi:hypothetical protein